MPSSGEAWYLHRSAYWIASGLLADHPVRQGDLFGPVQVGAERWDAAIIVHPTCELGKASVRDVQVSRVLPLSVLTDDRQKVAVQAGFSEREGQVRVAFAHTFFVAPVSGTRLAAPMWADLRQIRPAVRDQFDALARVGAMSHDARVTFIRRYVYFRFRLWLSAEQVRDLEGARIRADPTFAGPKPSWAS